MLITFEGVEGSGKTIQIHKTAEFIRKQNRECIITREPGDTEIGKKIRAILLDPENSELVPLAELFLYAADRAQHISERIRPALSLGKVVICDRFFDATTVYQGYARGLNLEIIEQIHSQVLGDLKPDITLLFDLDPETGLRRAWKDVSDGGRSGSETRFENEALDFHRKVREGYLALSEKEPERIIVIDASRSEDNVFRQISSVLTGRLNNQ